MKKLLPAILIIPVLLQAFSFTLIYAGYSFNKQFISASLCESRDIPKTRCEGKCYLNKELGKESEKESGKPVQIKNHTETFIIDDSTPFRFVFSWADAMPVFFEINYKYLFLTFLFRPPASA